MHAFDNMMMNGVPVFFAKMLARRDDPQTSHDAAERVVKSGQVASQCSYILSVLQTGDMNANEVADETGLLPHQVLKRFASLKDKGLAFKTDKKRGGQTVWTAKETE